MEASATAKLEARDDVPSAAWSPTVIGVLLAAYATLTPLALLLAQYR